MAPRLRVLIATSAAALALTASAVTAQPAGATPAPASGGASSTTSTAVKSIHILKQVSGTYTGAIPSHPGWGKVTWTKPATGGVSPAAAAACTLIVGPVTLPNGVNGNLEATTDQYCSGPFGVQQTEAHFDRSSWSGWRLYANNYTSGLTSNTFLTTTFVVDCGGGGQGTYDYRLVARGYATALGWSGWATYGGSQKQRFACGT